MDKALVSPSSIGKEYFLTHQNRFFKDHPCPAVDENLPNVDELLPAPCDPRRASDRVVNYSRPGARGER